MIAIVGMANTAATAALVIMVAGTQTEECMPAAATMRRIPTAVMEVIATTIEIATRPRDAATTGDTTTTRDANAIAKAYIHGTPAAAVAATEATETTIATTATNGETARPPTGKAGDEMNRRRCVGNARK